MRVSGSRVPRGILLVGSRPAWGGAPSTLYSGGIWRGGRAGCSQQAAAASRVLVRTAAAPAPPPHPPLLNALIEGKAPGHTLPCAQPGAGAAPGTRRRTPVPPPPPSSWSAVPPARPRTAVRVVRALPASPSPLSSRRAPLTLPAHARQPPAGRPPPCVPAAPPRCWAHRCRRRGVRVLPNPPPPPTRPSSAARRRHDADGNRVGGGRRPCGR